MYTILLILFASLTASASSSHNCLPQNDLFIPANEKLTPSGIDLETFDQITDDIVNLYKPIFANERGWTLESIKKWDSGFVNAQATVDGLEHRQIVMFGGLARHEKMTADGYALVVCHELGHHYGGAPKKGGSSFWASSEGQSDYFATTKCLRRYFAHHNNAAILREKIIPETVAKNCELQFSEKVDQEICIRTALAGQDIAHFFKSIMDTPKVPKFTTPDARVVSTHQASHPNPQCRLDTYFQGALCNVDFDLPLGDKDVHLGACSRGVGDEVGVRPLCWFKPPAIQLKLFAN